MKEKAEKVLDKLNNFNTNLLNNIKEKVRPLGQSIKKHYKNSIFQRIIHFLRIDKLVSFLIKIQLPKRIFLLIIIPVVIYLFSQYLCDGKIEFERPRMKFNFLLIYLIITIIYCIVGKIKPALFLSMIISFLIGLINHFLTMFRGTPLVPWDIFSVNVAFRVLPTFKFTLNQNLLIGIVLFFVRNHYSSKNKINQF